MPQRHCRHVHANGALCKSPPLHKRDYCHFHLDQIGRQLRAARARARYQPASLRLPLLEDPFAVQVALMQVADAIVHNEIDVPRGRLLMSVLRTASRNLKELRDWDHEPVFAAGPDSREIIEWPSFEQENDLPPGFDLSVDPEVAFPPLQDSSGAPLNPSVGLSGDDGVQPAANIPGVEVYGVAADAALRAQIRQALGEAKTPVPQVTADQLELMDVYDREGQEAARKFSDQMVRNARRRERRLRRAQFEEQARHHNIKIAARRLVEEQREAEAAANLSAANAATVTDPAGDTAADSQRKRPGSEPAPQAREAGSGTA